MFSLAVLRRRQDYLLCEFHLRETDPRRAPCTTTPLCDQAAEVIPVIGPCVPCIQKAGPLQALVLRH